MAKRARRSFEVNTEYNLPNTFVDHFSTEALNNFVNGEQVEILAIALGKKIDSKIEIVELIYPSQDGKKDQVHDKGNIFNLMFSSWTNSRILMFF